jgi:hypothetical protein
MAQFKASSQHLPVVTKTCQDIRSPSRDLNPRLTEYDAGVLITGLRPVVLKIMGRLKKLRNVT